MAFYDLHVHTNMSIGENTTEEVAEMAKRLGYSGLGIVRYYTSKIENLPKMKDFDIVNAIMLKPQTPEDLNNEARKLRNKAEILMVHGGDYNINRAACENPLIDVLCHPELNRKDSGLDHICVKSAHDNDVAIEINFREILESYKKHRVHVIASIKKNVYLCQKYETKLITSSGAVTKWGMRSGRELASIANIMGLELENAISSTSTIPENLVRINREKLEGNRWEGGRIVNG